MLGLPAISEEEAVVKYKELDENMELLEKHILKDQPFLCGDEITIADIFCANEVCFTMFSRMLYCIPSAF